MTKFLKSAFFDTFELIETSDTAMIAIRKDDKFHVSPTDMLFMLYLVLKCASLWKFAAAHSRLKTATFESVMVDVIDATPALLAKNIEKLKGWSKLYALAAADSCLDKFNFIDYAVEVRF